MLETGCILGDRIKRALVIEKIGQSRKLKWVEVVEAAHPVPNEDGMRATKEILEIADNANTNDLVFVCATGGCSALMTMPVKAIKNRWVEVAKVVCSARWQVRFRIGNDWPS